MHPVIAKTFGGLTRQYYFRQFVFGLIFPALIIYASSQSPTHNALKAEAIAFFAINTVLYPYSRFVYESVVDFIIGKNVFFVNALMLLFVKIFTMLICWACAIFIAPVGLIYLFVRNSKAC
ncbi:hypothetical protein RO575_13205 [Methylomonas sp. MO1]|uniref:hypothetical protein n=1 Tax=Methylomonas sp. MO1 TaxID=3073619 RepID=UPI0028A4B33E|nr:hypothetical protein [Methylomonas sp. MO1]MDT4290519.1 hypothetical protein [Methylomonas sp. MO1]